MKSIKANGQKIILGLLQYLHGNVTHRTALWYKHVLNMLE
jgi:hypothetical protein